MARTIFIILIAFLLTCLYLFFKGDSSPVSSTPLVIEAPVANPREVNGFADWILYSEKEGKFRVFFPTLPQHAIQNIKDNKTQEIRNYEMYIAEKGDGTSFMVNTITFPPDADLKDKQKIYKEFVRELLASNVNNEAKKSAVTKFHNHEALDFEMSNGSAQMDSKLFMVGNTLVVLSKLSPAIKEPNDDFSFFVNSFELLNTAKPEASFTQEK